MKRFPSLPAVRTSFALTAVVLLAACAGVGGASPSGRSLPAGPQRAQGLASFQSGSINKIAHVVIVIQENRSVDNLFQGFPGADTQSYGYDSKGKKIKLRQAGLQTTWDVEHDSTGFLEACNGTGSYPGTDCQMNGFDKEQLQQCGGSLPPCPKGPAMYAYVPHSETKPYFDMGEQYVLADETFASNFDVSSFVAHQYLIAAQASATVDYPNGLLWGCYGTKTERKTNLIATLSQERKVQWNHRIHPCFDNETLGDELDTASPPISWAYYTGAVPNGLGHLWSAYAAIKHIYNGPDWNKDVKSPQTVFFTDVQNGKLPAVSWITPLCKNSDHASCGSDTGPAWVASIVNAVGQSQYWSSTAIFVVWDDPGGWYDHVAPQMLDYDGLGFRVPMLVISPYAKKGYVSHTPYELASILRFVEDRFGLTTLSASDARATSPAADCFDFSRKPRKFVKIRSPKDVDYFLHQPPDFRPPDNG